VRIKEWGGGGGGLGKKCMVIGGDGYIAKYLVRKFTKIPSI
jgi:hypothetical protein